MASAQTTSGGWAQNSPYLGQNMATAPSSGQPAVGSDGNVASNDVGAQLGQALSAYHTHQSAVAAPTPAPTPAPTADTSGYGAAAANANNQALGAALQAQAPAATPAPTASYAAPSMSKLGIYTGTTASGAAPTVGGTTTATAPANPTTAGNAGATQTAGQATYIEYMGADGRGAFAKYDPATGQYLAVDDTGWQTQKNVGINGLGTVNQVQMPDGSFTTYNDFTDQGKTFSLTAYNTQLAAAAAAQAAQKAALAQGSNAATVAAQQTDTTPATSVNNNQDFINQLQGQLGNINTAPGVQAADQTSADTQNALSSQLSTSGYQSGGLGASARYGAGASVTAEGQGALSHEQAAANAFDATFAQIGQAATQQLSLADSETQQQASADVQSIADEVSSLQSQLGQLSTTTANQVAQQLAQLQDQISAYQNGVASYTGTAQASAADFKAILAAAAQVGAIAAAA